MTVQTTAAHESFGHLLKSWRGRRHMSQLALSLEARVSQRHVSFLESGRSQPSRQMVLALSEALDVPLRERNLLLSTAGFAPRYGERPLGDTTMSAVNQAVERLLTHHAPFPGVAMDRNYDLLRTNDAFDALLDLFGDADRTWQATCGDGPRNLLRLTLHPEGARPFIANFETIAPVLITRAQRECLARGAAMPPALRDAAAELDLPAGWYTPDPEFEPPPVVTLELSAGPRTIRLFTMITTFGTPADITTDELRVELFFPADAATETLLRSSGRSSKALDQR